MGGVFDRVVLDACGDSGNAGDNEYGEFFCWTCMTTDFPFSIADYASVVFVGFALISGVWYLISKFPFLLFWLVHPLLMNTDGRRNYHGPPIPDEDGDNNSSEQEISEKKT